MNVDEELLFNDDPTMSFEVDQEVMALDENTGGRKRATVLKSMGMGVFLLKFHHDDSEQACYATLMHKAPPKTEKEEEIEVIKTDVEVKNVAGSTTVITTLTLRNPATQEE